MPHPCSEMQSQLTDKRISALESRLQRLITKLEEKKEQKRIKSCVNEQKRLTAISLGKYNPNQAEVDCDTIKYHADTLRLRYKSGLQDREYAVALAKIFFSTYGSSSDSQKLFKCQYPDQARIFNNYFLLEKQERAQSSMLKNYRFTLKEASGIICLTLIFICWVATLAGENPSASAAALKP